MKKELRLEIYNKYDGHCAYCGKEIEYKDMQADHIKPLIRREKPKLNYRGCHSEETRKMIKEQYDRELAYYRQYTKAKKQLESLKTMNPACRRCNLYKGTMDIETFRSEISKQVSRLRKKNWNFRIAEDYGLVVETDKQVVFYFEELKGNNDTGDNI